MEQKQRQGGNLSLTEFSSKGRERRRTPEVEGRRHRHGMSRKGFAISFLGCNDFVFSDTYLSGVGRGQQRFGLILP